MTAGHPVSRQTLETLYAAFARLDGAAMAACYAENATFDDEAFSLKGRREIGGMWTMLCDGTKAKARDAWRLTATVTGDRSAHWEAWYRFTATGRMVHNVIDSEFEFGADGLITRQRDRFDFWRWARQALGAPGWLLGWTPFLRHKVRATAAGNLAVFLAKQPR